MYSLNCSPACQLLTVFYSDIASVSVIEGKNWRHGDIEDVIKDIAFVQGMKWTSLMISRVYFGNWLRD